MGTTRKVLRQDIIKRLYSPRIIVSVTTADSSIDSLTDSVLSPQSSMEDYVESYIYILENLFAGSGALIDDPGGINDSDIEVVVTDGTKFSIGDGIFVFQSTGEIFAVSGIAGNTLTIIRGIQGTTPSSHDDGKVLLIWGPATNETARIVDVEFSGSNSDLVIKGLSANALDTTDYEIHYVFHPEDVNDVINDIIRFGTRSTLQTLTLDINQTLLERDVLVNGALSILKRRLAVGKNADEAGNLNVEAQIHERDYLLGLVRQGYEPMTRVREINVSN